MREICKRVHSGGKLAAPVMALIGPGADFSPALRSVSQAFVMLQEARHRADYDLSASILREETRVLLSQAQEAVTTRHTIAGTDEANVFLIAMLHDRLGR